MTPSASTRLNAPRRERELARACDGRTVDVLVVGLGVTGAGVALDAASRGLEVVAVDAHDLAFGTSRWSSKLVHGGLRYLSHGHVRIAHESAVERGVLMTTTAPHLTRPLPMLLPSLHPASRSQSLLVACALLAGDALRASARTSRDVLPRPRRLSPAQVAAAAPALRRAGCRGGLLSWDGQLEDDARLVTALARTAAGHGASILARTRVLELTGGGALVRDERTGQTASIKARAVINAAGVWAGDLVPDVSLRPSRGSHLVLEKDTLAGLEVAVTVPVPGEWNRFVMVLPQPDGLVYVGLTDEPTDEIVDEPRPSESEVEFLLGVVGAVFDRPLDRGDVVGQFAGLRPLLHTPGRHTADLSRRHTVLTSADGVVTVVGGKLTTYRQMAQEAVDAVTERFPATGPCRTRDIPLVGAASRDALGRIEAPPRLVRRYGAEAGEVMANAVAITGDDAEGVLAAVAEGVPTTIAELVFGVTHEGALDVDDLLDRRTRIGLVPTQRAAARQAAARALELAGPDPVSRAPQ